jgi:translation elongation factor EF-G
MASALGLLVIGIIAVAVVCIAIKIIVALLPVGLAVGVVGILGLAFCDNTCATQSEPVKTHVEKIDKYVEDVKDAAEDVGNKINEYVEDVQDAIEEIDEFDEIDAIKDKIEQKAGNIQQKYHQQIRSMTRQKPDVNLEDILPELDSAISVVVWAYCVASGDENFKPLVTSANDYEGHSAQSAHYSGAAVDFRIKDMGSLAERKELVALIREELGDRFTVLHEDIGKINEHLHVQLRSGTYDKTVAFNKQETTVF